MAHSHFFFPAQIIPAATSQPVLIPWCQFHGTGPQTPPDFPAWLPTSILLAGKSQGPDKEGCGPSASSAMRGSITLHKPEWKLAPQKSQTWLGPKPTSREDPHRVFLSLPPQTGVGLKNYETFPSALGHKAKMFLSMPKILDKISYRVSHSPSPGLRAGKSSPQL